MPYESINEKEIIETRCKAVQAKLIELRALAESRGLNYELISHIVNGLLTIVMMHNQRDVMPEPEDRAMVLESLSLVEQYTKVLETTPEALEEEAAITAQAFADSRGQALEHAKKIIEKYST